MTHNRITKDKIPHSQAEYMLENWDKMSHLAISRALGLGSNTLYIYARELGLPIGTTKGPRKSEVIQEDVCRLYPDHTAEEVAQMLGCTKAMVYAVANRLRLNKSEAFQKARKESLKRQASGTRSKEVRDKISRGIKKIRRQEKFRALSGMPQKTKLVIHTIPTKTANRKYSLVKFRGYHYSPDDPYLMLYDDNTKRVVRENRDKRSTEEYITNVFHLRFAPITSQQQ